MSLEKLCAWCQAFSTAKLSFFFELPEKCLLSNNIHDYTFVSQGKVSKRSIIENKVTYTNKHTEILYRVVYITFKQFLKIPKLARLFFNICRKFQAKRLREGRRDQKFFFLRGDIHFHKSHSIGISLICHSFFSGFGWFDWRQGGYGVCRRGIRHPGLYQGGEVQRLQGWWLSIQFQN